MRVVCFPHASNIVGEINPVAEIVQKAKSFGAVTVVDGVSYAPHGLPDLLALGCDVYLFSAYKVYGPHQGIMAIRPSLASELPNQGHFFNDTQPRKRLTPAGPDHAQIAASAGIVDYLETRRRHRRRRRRGHDAVPQGAQRHARAGSRAARAAARLSAQQEQRSPHRPLRRRNLRAPTVSLAIAEHAALGRRSPAPTQDHGRRRPFLRLPPAAKRSASIPATACSACRSPTTPRPREIDRLIAALDVELK